MKNVQITEAGNETDERKFTLRIPADLLAEIQNDAKNRPDRISINSWLIGAALERLAKRRNGGEMAA